MSGTIGDGLNAALFEPAPRKLSDRQMSLGPEDIVALGAFDSANRPSAAAQIACLIVFDSGGYGVRTTGGGAISPAISRALRWK